MKFKIIIINLLLILFFLTVGIGIAYANNIEINSTELNDDLLFELNKTINTNLQLNLLNFNLKSNYDSCSN
ncbi:hypothetical protein HOK68_04210 [Candidatus Woesearchaeota archaeon]|nr:hypothetical protein [Candidatus Woesearchaeota archaeon]MBT4387468.1 hypothetical protein [Candidatus Woesearchaeota archaeon]MBT4595882.1 hypothetical protein [Candidatus Woesearchaeota archaeon]MBT5740768.1 hypothetical protein [Candidatus Woesearchaeota archaeon]MBT6505954.1 hypothetical protein [Candidatus Woesearchaeota archaeon]